MGNTVRPFKTEEFYLILDTCSELFTWHTSIRWQAMIAVQGGTGVRAGELLALRVRDVSSDMFSSKGVVTLPKHSTKGKLRGRVIPVSTIVNNHLNAWLAYRNATSLDDVLFSSQWRGANQNSQHPIFNNEQIHYVRYMKAIEKLVKHLKLEPPLGTHSLRKMFAMKIMNKTSNDLPLLQKAMGHKSIKSTLHYLWADDEQVKEAIVSLFD